VAKLCYCDRLICTFSAGLKLKSSALNRLADRGDVFSGSDEVHVDTAYNHDRLPVSGHNLLL
jgi:hypothetical protein